ncbi:MAG: ATP-binding protein, partial [Planctomycetota bacterium]|nr:ATP-binding protein [Planctomycetota bacterium]
EQVPLHDNFTATQMFLVAREAVHNAVKHAEPRNIVIQLNNQDGVRLSVRDDGRGVHHDLQNSEGMGLRIMRHRCSLIGGNLTIQSPAEGGTLLTCTLQKESDHGNN